jgi:hypothetical protein
MVLYGILKHVKNLCMLKNMFSNMLGKGYMLWNMVKTCQKHIKDGVCALKHGRKMLKRIYILWNMSTTSYLFCSNIPKICQGKLNCVETCQVWFTCFETCLNLYKKRFICFETCHKHVKDLHFLERLLIFYMFWNMYIRGFFFFFFPQTSLKHAKDMHTLKHD